MQVESTYFVKKFHNLIKFRTKNFYHYYIGTLFSLKNTQRSKLVTVLLTVINILSHFIHITIGRLIKGLSKKMFCCIKLSDNNTNNSEVVNYTSTELF